MARRKVNNVHENSMTGKKRAAAKKAAPAAAGKKGLDEAVLDEILYGDMKEHLSEKALADDATVSDPDSAPDGTIATAKEPEKPGPVKAAPSKAKTETAADEPENVPAAETDRVPGRAEEEKAPGKAEEDKAPGRAKADRVPSRTEADKAPVRTEASVAEALTTETRICASENKELAFGNKTPGSENKTPAYKIEAFVSDPSQESHDPEKTFGQAEPDGVAAGLKELTEQWMQLERKTLEQRRNAARFYDEHLMKLIEKEYLRNNQDMVFEDVEHMVVSVGTSYEPLALDICLLRPKKLLFLYTEASGDTMAKVIGYCGLKPTQYDKSLVSEVDPMDIYREIKAFYLRSGKPGKMYIDFTGGTKAMSAAAALAGAMIDVQMVYCSTDDYLVDFRKPNPGSERLMYIENPLAVFGELEIEKAFELFDKNNYAGAKEKFSVLKDNIPDPALRQQLGFVSLLAASYEAWDALDFIPAYQNMLQLQKEIERDRKLHRDYLLMDFSRHIDRQRAMLEHLSRIPALQEARDMPAILDDADILHSLVLTIYQNAKTREKQEKFDMATLLLYRLLEMMSQRRLSRYGIFTSRPDYQHAKYNIAKFPELRGKSPDERLSWMANRYRNISETVFRKEPDRFLPTPIASLDGFILLAAMGDPLVGGRLADAISMIKRIRSMVYLRNNSIFAHGLGPVSHKDFARFRTFVFDMFRNFCGIEKMDFEDCERCIDWINPMHSANYARAIR